MTSDLTLDPRERQLLDEIDESGTERARLEAQRRAALDLRYPKPTEQYVQEMRAQLEAAFQTWRFGDSGNSDQGADEGPPGLQRIRQMRYHRDRMPQKWQRMLQVPYRVRSNLTANEIERTVALATRNPPKVRILPASREPEDGERAEKETRWAQELGPALERAYGPIIRQFFDTLFECGDAVFEVYITDAFDDIDFDKDPDEEDDAFHERTDRELQRVATSGRLPFGVRVPDMMTVLYDIDDDGEVYVAMFVETKPYRVVHSTLTKRLSAEKLAELRLPRPGDRGWPGDGVFSGVTGSPSGTVETIRYYDRRWYGYMVGGKFVDGPVEHEMPAVPVIPAWGVTTASSQRHERLQGIVWGTVEQEQAINDTLTTSVDIGVTFSRPRPTIETPVGGSLRSPTGRPSTLKLDGTGAIELMPGQQLKDAFGTFQSRIPPELMQTLLAVRQRSSLNPVAQGESPGADPSGFALNSMQAASQMRYEILLDNGARSYGKLVDFLRSMVRDGPIGERVFLGVQGARGDTVEWLGLGPEETSEVPAVVSIDPLNDVNRLAIRESLMVGNQRGLVPRRVVQEMGYGADDPDAWDDELAEDFAFVNLMQQAFMEAMTIVSGQQVAVGPDGQPVPAETAGGEMDALRAAGGAPAPVRGATIGREAAGGDQLTARNAARSRGGQQPRNQGAPVGGNGPTP